MDDVTWGALMLALTVLGGLYTWWAFRHRGLAPGLRGLALTLLPVAAWLTGTLTMFSRIAHAITSWATHLVLSPAVWTGVALAGTSVVLLVVAKGIDARRPREPRVRRGRSKDALGPASSTSATSGGTAADDDLDEIEELLRRRGIE